MTEYNSHLDSELQVNDEVEFSETLHGLRSCVGVVDQIIREDGTLLVKFVRVRFPDSSSIRLDRTDSLRRLFY